MWQNMWQNMWQTLFTTVYSIQYLINHLIVFSDHATKGERGSDRICNDLVFKACVRCALLARSLLRLRCVLPGSLGHWRAGNRAASSYIFIKFHLSTFCTVFLIQSSKYHLNTSLNTLQTSILLIIKASTALSYSQLTTIKVRIIKASWDAFTTFCKHSYYN